MPEVATAGIFLRIPVISELDLRILVTGRSKEDEREASFLVIRPPPFLKAQEIEKSDSFVDVPDTDHGMQRSEEHTSELQSLMRISYAVFCLKKKKHTNKLPAFTHNK